jgi:phosphatidate cytidylyltransferase
MRQRVVTSIVLFALVFGVFFLPATLQLPLVFFAILGVFVSFEIEKLVTNGKFYGLAGILAAGYISSQNHKFCSIVSVTATFAGVALLWFAPKRVHVSGVFLLMLGSFITLFQFTFLGGSPELKASSGTFLALATPIWAGDIAAYFVGKARGGTKMAPEISPNKTVAGAIGHVIAGSLALYLVHLLFVPFSLSDTEVIALGISASSAAQIGDLLQSKLKRAANLKDSGTLLPGHGGVYDRVDGLLVALPLLLLAPLF